ncbi:MAG: hypothetical protein B7Z37_16355 [Verrucomicrobia bacterium 12-59-8]|nr:MAG: hypothetical protein B7Z37_16355 [Verrucomicrobia bacterium 12-59-8]
MISDITDVQAMWQHQLIAKGRLWELFQAIQPALIRHPAITPAEFHRAVEQVLFIMIALDQLPGGELIIRGLADYAEGRLALESCLLAVGWNRLQRGGLPRPTRSPVRFPEPEMQLYSILRSEQGDAFSRYNALLRRLISFEQSLEKQSTSDQERHHLLVRE